MVTAAPEWPYSLRIRALLAQVAEYEPGSREWGLALERAEEVEREIRAEAGAVAARMRVARAIEARLGRAWVVI